MSTLSLSDIQAIMALVDQSEFDHLKLEMGDLKLELHRAGATVIAEQPAITAAPLAAPTAPVAPKTTGEGVAVPAPLLGTFYHAPKPGAAPYVAVGDVVSADTVIGVIEVMKLMNTVPAGVAGVVAEIAAPNGMLVEHGQTLIRVRPA